MNKQEDYIDFMHTENIYMYRRVHLQKGLDKPISQNFQPGVIFPTRFQRI